MSANDAVMWHIERDPLLRSTITTVWILDRPPDRDRLDATLAQAPVVLPRLRQRVVTDPLNVAAPRWVADTNFDLGYHLHHETLDGDGSETALLALAAHLHEQAFDKERSPWEIHLVDGLSGGRSAAVLKIHHAIADGLGLLQMTGALIDLDRDPQPTADPAIALDREPTGAAPTGTSQVLDAMVRRLRGDLDLTRRATATAVRGLGDLARNPLGTARRAVETASSLGHLVKPAPAPLSPLMTERSLSMSFHALSCPLADLKAAATSSGASINDVFVTAVVGGIHRYHLANGVPLNELRMNMPISVRGGDTQDLAGNQFVPARFIIPVTSGSVGERLRDLQACMAHERAEPALPLVNEVSEIIQRSGPAGATLILSGMLKAVDLTTSNVPGPQVPLYTAGARIDKMIPFGPCAGAAVNVTLLSYDGAAHIGVNADRAAVENPEALMEHLADSLEEIVVLGRT